MNYKYLNIILTLFFAFTLSVFGQKRENRIDDEFPTPIAFPYEYFGSYSGNLKVSNNEKTLANIPTDFAIQSTDIEKEFTYVLTFVKGQTKETKNYKLFAIDETKGFYAIKDQDGLEFTAILIDNTLYSTFEIENDIIFSSMQFTNSGQVYLKIITSKKVINSKTKKLKKEQAKSANTVLVQKAKLTKQRNH